MKDQIKRIGLYETVIRTVTFYDLISLTSRAFKTKLDSFQVHNDFFAEELENRRDWKFYALKVYKKKWYGYALAKKIIWIFLDLLMHDLIYENDRFVFPQKKLAIKVADRPNKHKKNYKYNVATRGKNYGEMLIYISRTFYSRHMKIPYYLIFTQRHRKKIAEHAKIFDYQ